MRNHKHPYLPAPPARHRWTMDRVSPRLHIVTLQRRRLLILWDDVESHLSDIKTPSQAPWQVARRILEAL